MANKELTKVFDLVLDGPGMSDPFRLSVGISRKHLLLICMLVENGVEPAKEKTEELSAMISKETKAELLQLIPEILKKGGPRLPEYYERLKSL